MDQELASSTLPLPMEYNRQLQAGSTNRAGVKRITSTVFANQNTPIKGSTVSANDTSNKSIRFLIPPQGFLDGKSSYLVVKAKLTQNGGTADNSLIFTPNSDTWLQRITIKTPQSVVIEDLDDAGTLGAIMRRNKSKNYKCSVGMSALNDVNYMMPSLISNTRITNESDLIDTLSRRQQRDNYYIIELRASDFWNAENYHPLQAMSLGNSHAFSVELEFKKANDMLIGFTPNITEASYEISEYFLMCDYVIDPSKEEEIKEAIKTNPILFHYKQWRHYNNTLSVGSSQNSLLITEFQQSLQEILTVFRLKNDINNILKDSTLFTNPGAVFNDDGTDPTPSMNDTFSGGLKQYFTKIGNDYYPLQKIDTTANTSINTYEMVKGMQKNKKYNDGNDAIMMSAFDSTVPGQTSDNGYDLILNTSFRVYPDDSAGVDQDFSSGINTKGNAQVCNIILTTDAIPGLTQADHYTHFDSSLVIMSNETYVVS
jgi:hypothetical protein